MPTAHAKLSASGAHRWLNCPGSVKASSLYPSTSSIYADEGTLAHAAAEEAINSHGKVTAATKKKIIRFYEAHEELGESLDSMFENLTEYIDYVSEEYAAELAEDKAATLLTEQRVDFSKYVPGGFGTSDVVLIRKGKLHIIDLKYGKGVEVSAEDNPQLRLYALGAIEALDLAYEIEDVVMTIYQPRLGNVSTAFTTKAELESWGKDVIIPGAKEALGKNPPMHSGDWCTFCPHKASCKQRAKDLKEIDEYRKAITLDPEEIAEILDKGTLVKKFIEDVQEKALSDALEGIDIPGFKVVEGKSNRKFVCDEKDIIERAGKAGFDRSLLYETKLLTLTAIEKLLGKKTFAEYMADIVEKPQGKPTLVPESDKRPAINKSTAADDFADEFND